MEGDSNLSFFLCKRLTDSDFDIYCPAQCGPGSYSDQTGFVFSTFFMASLISLTMMMVFMFLLVVMLVMRGIWGFETGDD